MNNQGWSSGLLYVQLLTILAATAMIHCPAYTQETREVTAEVLSPREYQVVQRDHANRGTIRVALYVDGQPTTVEVRLDLTSSRYKGTSTDWVALAPTDEAGAYTGEITAVAGGWYELQVRVQTAEGNPVVATVPHIGIGDVFITAGQSNAANHGQPPLQSADGRVAAYHAGAWQPAHDPLPGATGEGGSPWPHLGDMLTRSLQMPIGFASVAIGGSPSSLVDVLQQLGPGGAQALLWHQGETDSIQATSAQQYCDNLATIIHQLPQDAGWCPPWVVAGASFVPAETYGDTKATAAEVRRGQALLWQRGIARQGPVTDDLVGPLFRCDTLHFSELGLRAHAERWFAFAMLWAQFYADVPLCMSTSN